MPGTAVAAHQVGSGGEGAVEAVMRHRLLADRVQHEPAQATAPVNVRRGSDNWERLHRLP